MVHTHGGPCVLDRIYLPYANANSGPAAKFGLGCQLFLSDAGKAGLRERSFLFLGDYWQMFQDRTFSDSHSFPRLPCYATWPSAVTIRLFP